MRPIYIALFLSYLLAAGLAAQDGDEAPLRPSAIRLLVKFAPGVQENAQESLAKELGARLERFGPYADFILFRFDTAPSSEITAWLDGNDAVIYAERDARYRTSSRAFLMESNDPLAHLQWSYRMIRVDAAHDMNFGSDPGVTVAILDTGIAYMSAARFLNAPDLDGTIVLPGYDFVSDDNVAVDEGDGKLGHGTFVAGVVAQTTHNGRGTAGIAFNASLLPVRVVDRRGISMASELARGIRYAVANGASLIVLGVAGPSDSRAVLEAVRFAYSCGVPVVAPAGNSTDVQFPARYREVLSVGAVDASGRKAYYSPESGPVDIYAPGGDLRAGIDANADGFPDGVVAESFTEHRFTRFGPVFMEGTSAAAAHVGGAAALLLSQIGPVAPDRLYHAIRNSARLVSKLPILDAARLLFRASLVAR